MNKIFAVVAVSLAAATPLAASAASTGPVPAAISVGEAADYPINTRGQFVPSGSTASRLASRASVLASVGDAPNYPATTGIYDASAVARSERAVPYAAAPVGEAPGYPADAQGPRLATRQPGRDAFATLTSQRPSVDGTLYSPN